jgi:phage terminase small subunit
VKPPEHLSDGSKAVWKATVEEFEMSAAELVTLRLALEAVDRSDQARAEIEKAGAIVEDRYGGLRAHPAVAIERDSRLAAARLFKQLNIEVTEPKPSPMALRPRRFSS